jgi:hypothetical protein
MIEIKRVEYKNEYDYTIGARGYKQVLQFNDLACKFHIQQHKQKQDEILLLIEELIGFYVNGLPEFKSDVFFMLLILCQMIDMKLPLK